MEPPFSGCEIIGYTEMNKRTAKKWLDWYVAESDNRLQQLFSAVKATEGPLEKLDYSFESIRFMQARIRTITLAGGRLSHKVAGVNTAAMLELVVLDTPPVLQTLSHPILETH